MTIRRNANGKQNIRDLRSALEQRDDVTVQRFGDNWIVTRYAAGVVHETQCPYYFDERAAMQQALFGAAEDPAEAEYARRAQKVSGE